MGCDHGGRGRNVVEFGDYFRAQRWNQGPGADQPGFGKDLIKAKVASSIAHLYQRPRVWLEGFYGSWTTPGVEFAVSAELASVSVDEALDTIEFSGSCTLDSREDYSDELYSGKYDLWTGCGGTDSLYVVLAAHPADGSLLLLVQVQIVSDRDLEALDYILASFVAGG